MPTIQTYLRDDLYLKWKNKIKEKPELRRELRSVMINFVNAQIQENDISH